MVSSEVTLMKIQSANPAVTVRQPTARSELSESVEPIKKSTSVMPRRAASEICGDQVSITGT